MPIYIITVLCYLSLDTSGFESKLTFQWDFSLNNVLVGIFSLMRGSFVVQV